MWSCVDMCRTLKISWRTSHLSVCGLRTLVWEICADMNDNSVITKYPLKNNPVFLIDMNTFIYLFSVLECLLLFLKVEGHSRGNSLPD